jgi:hypothetical protein
MGSTSPNGTLARLRRAVFTRHSHPGSAWSRWASTPLAVLAVWTRDWRHGALVAAWMVLNPVVFPEPRDDRNWATRAMLGEERWITERPKDAALAVQGVSTVAFGLALVSAYRRRPVGAVAGTAAMMALILVYWEQMARYYERTTQQG